MENGSLLAAMQLLLLTIAPVVLMMLLLPLRVLFHQEEWQPKNELPACQLLQREVLAAPPHKGKRKGDDAL